ncbi:dihydrodipicolinate synthase family protein [Membranihabitans marinus]|uniref:dihydrodipicolinate synthase family protein n=1 Tax=Membranihabitans marinus TaxID=1227546 RepID=UPI001F031684|nr:dihydrodipicolinate synthase family protein [Membranihabitans marinus]
MNIKGLIAATYAPLNTDESLNLNLVPAYGDFLKRNAVSGCFINGSTGDFASLTVQERKDLFIAWAQNKPDDFYLINHVGHTSIKVAKELAQHSAQNKADAIAALSPFYFRLPSVSHLVEFCAQVANAAPDLPFYYYHIPVLAGAEFSMQEFLELAQDRIPNLAGIKYTYNNMVDFKYCLDYSNGKYDILFGIDEVFLSSLPFGAEGWVGSTYNHLAPLYHLIRKAYESGDQEKAANLQAKSMQFVDLLNARGGFNGAAKSFMKVLGMDCGPSRFPHVTLSVEELVEVEKELTDIGIIDYLSR